jgi:Protein of unknown function (DUF2934)
MFTQTQGQRHPGQAGNAEMRDGSAEKPAPARQTVSGEERSRLIQERAYGLWEQAGRPDGDTARERFWCEAEAEVMAPHVSDE